MLSRCDFFDMRLYSLFYFALAITAAATLIYTHPFTHTLINHHQKTSTVEYQLVGWSLVGLFFIFRVCLSPWLVFKVDTPLPSRALSCPLVPSRAL